MKAAESSFEPNCAQRAGHDGAYSALLLAIYWRTVELMIGIWYRSDTFAHGLLVFPISVWLIWRGRAELARVEAWPLWPGLALLAAVGFFLAARGSRGRCVWCAVELVVMLQAAITTVLGVEGRTASGISASFSSVRSAGRRVAHPTLSTGRRTSRESFARDWHPGLSRSNHFVIPSGSWSVVEECNGIR